MRRVEGHSNLAKMENGAVIVTDNKVYQRAKKNKAERERLNNLESRMDRIEALLINISEKL